jgi:hypothetical protein
MQFRQNARKGDLVRSETGTPELSQRVRLGSRDQPELCPVHPRKRRKSDMPIPTL